MSSDSSPPPVEAPPAASPTEPDRPDTSPASATDRPADHDSRATKRRKNCPESLNNLQESSESNRSRRHHQSSFTFDTAAAPTPQFTPKFGSFKLPSASPDEKQEAPTGDREQTAAEAEQEEEEAANGATEN